MQFMILVKATQTSETGAMPSQELIEAIPGTLLCLERTHLSPAKTR